MNHQVLIDEINNEFEYLDLTINSINGLNKLIVGDVLIHFIHF